MNWGQPYKSGHAHTFVRTAELPEDFYMHQYRDGEWSFDVDLRDDTIHNFRASDLRAIADKLDELNQGKVLEP